jgi:DNA (cytosine-5)-methyltransferase 1
MNELALFAGVGGGLLASRLNGWRTVCAVEISEFCRRVLELRQCDGSLDPFPIWDDVRSFSGTAWRGRIDVVSGGFPCQDISRAGTKTGLDGDRSGLWVEMARIIREVEPRYAFVENSADLVIRGLDIVLGDLAEMGMDARWGIFSAADAGARHRRERVFIVADRDGFVGTPGPWADLQFRQHENEPFCNGLNAQDSGTLWLEMADARAGMDDDVAHRVVRTHAIGNGQVPVVAAGAWRVLTSSQSAKRLGFPERPRDQKRDREAMSTLADTVSFEPATIKHEPTAMGFRCKCGQAWPCPQSAKDVK